MNKVDLEFKVASYALYDAINGLKNSCGTNEYMNVWVTKEDNDLVVRCKKEYSLKNIQDIKGENK